jgi:hypothetical protein
MPFSSVILFTNLYLNSYNIFFSSPPIVPHSYFTLISPSFLIFPLYSVLTPEKFHRAFWWALATKRLLFATFIV